jgi:putative endonuclease
MRPCWYVYLLHCADGTLYCGATNDLERRMGRHRAGQVKYTRGRLPVEMLWADAAGDMSEALRREWYLKQWPRSAKLILCGP